MNKYNIKFYKTIRFFTNIHMKLYHAPIVINKEILPENKFILAGNHISANDVLLLAYAIETKRNPRFIAKKELFKTKFTSWFMTNMGAIPIDREKPSSDTLKDIVKMIKNDNEIVAIFPEGTRSKDGVLDFKGGANVIAAFAKAPIIPFGISGEYGFRKKPVITFGEPIDITKVPKKDREIYLQEKVKTLIRK